MSADSDPEEEQKEAIAIATTQLPLSKVNADIIAGSIVGSSFVVLLTASIVVLVLLIVRRGKTKNLMIFASNDTNVGTNLTNPIYDGE